MQRGCPTSNRPPFDFVSPCALAEAVPAQESSTRRSFGESNAHTEPAAAIIMEAHIFQRNPEAGTDTPVLPHIHGRRILRKIGSPGVWKGESRKYLLTIRSILTRLKMHRATKSFGARARAIENERERSPAHQPFRRDGCTCNPAFRRVKVRGPATLNRQ